MGAFSIWHIVVVLVVILLVFGAGKLPRVMGDFAKGIKSFKAGMKEGAEPPPATPTGPAGNVTDARATTEDASKTTTTSGEKA